MEEKQKIKNTIWIWVVIGAFAGFLVGAISGGIVFGGSGAETNTRGIIILLFGIMGACIFAFQAYRSSVKAGGGAPSWLWRSSGNVDNHDENILKEGDAKAYVDSKDESDQNLNAVSLWNPSAVVNWSVLFTPAFGALLQAKNWKALGNIAASKKSMIWFYAGLGVVLLFMFFPLTRIVFFILFLVAWYLFSGREQVEYLKEKDIAFKKNSFYKPVIFALIILSIYSITANMVAWTLMKFLQKKMNLPILYFLLLI